MWECSSSYVPAIMDGQAAVLLTFSGQQGGVDTTEFVVVVKKHAALIICLVNYIAFVYINHFISEITT